MEITPKIQDTITAGLQPIIQELEKYKYLPLAPIALSEKSYYNVTRSLYISFEKTENRDHHADLIALLSIPESTWELSIALFKDFRSCHLSVLMPDLPQHKDPQVLIFQHDDDPKVLSANMKKTVDALLEIMGTDFQPYLSGEKWANANLERP
ncbi:MAG: hypothetical protein BroJett041_23560 [Candidatus Jettenia caeni]|nr:MAG: hypothetical protein BroJett041_23560 [Candidatus Jettenia caeni]